MAEGSKLLLYGFVLPLGAIKQQPERKPQGNSACHVHVYLRLASAHLWSLLPVLCQYCRCLSVKRPLLFSQEDMPRIRKRIYKELCECRLDD